MVLWTYPFLKSRRFLPFCGVVLLAGCFHRFYTVCRIKGEEDAVLKARLKLADETRSVLKNGLALLGVEAPEKM